MLRSFDKPILCPIVVGRTSDLIAMDSFLERASNGEGQLVLLAGEAGLGKSRLVREVKTFAVKRNAFLFQGSCFPSDISCPYAPLLDLFSAHFADATAAEIALEVAPDARELFPLLPNSVHTLPEIADLPALPILEPEQEKRRLFAALTHVFVQKSLQHPVLFIIEDLHWCDDLSLEFLHYLARRSVSRPFFLLMTYRSDEVRPELAHWLAQLDRERLGQELTLSHLARSNVDGMLRAIFDPPLSFQRELLDQIYTLTEGNPFFVEEMLKSLITTGHLAYEDGVWKQKDQNGLQIPRSIRDALQQRTLHLSESARQVLCLASVSGRRFTFALLQLLTSYDEATLLDILKELIKAQLIIEESAEQLAFRHALTWQAVYAELLVRERRKLHGQIAEMLEHLYMHKNMPEYIQMDLSRHFYEAEMWPQALIYAMRAGERAQTLHAPEVAIEHFSRALIATQQQKLEPSLVLYRLRGQAYETLGKFEEACRDYENGLNAARATHDLRNEWQFLIDLGFLWSGRDYMRGGAYYQQAMELARTSNESSMIAHSLNRVGNWHLNREQPQEALRYQQEALAIFQKQDERQGIAETLDLLGMTCYLGGDLVQSALYYEQAIPLFQEFQDQQGLTSILGTLILCGGNYQAKTLIPVTMSVAKIVHDGEYAVQLAREIGQRSGEAYALMNLGFSLGPRGEYGRALECLAVGLERAEEVNHRQWLTGILCAQGALYYDLLQLSRAEASLQRAMKFAQELGSQFWSNIASGFLAQVYVATKKLSQAERLLDHVLTRETPTRAVGQRLLWCASAELALAQRKPQRTLEIVEKLLSPDSDGQNVSHLLKLRGEVLLFQKRYAEAETSLKAAQISAQRDGLRSLLWRIELSLHVCSSRQRHSEEAAQALEACKLLVTELADTIHDEELRNSFSTQADAIIASHSQITPLRAEKRAFEGLTAREREIAGLIAQGKYNREIAELLVVSERTVETHVSNIMLKLGFTSRRQITTWALKKGLVTEEE
jgi:DNA-binding CsgD family transcriptional regulator/predicted negative regulator of RcsB-dependent stress response